MRHEVALAHARYHSSQIREISLFEKPDYANTKSRQSHVFSLKRWAQHSPSSLSALPIAVPMTRSLCGGLPPPKLLPCPSVVPKLPLVDTGADNGPLPPMTNGGGDTRVLWVYDEGPAKALFACGRGGLWPET